MEKFALHVLERVEVAARLNVPEAGVGEARLPGFGFAGAAEGVGERDGRAGVLLGDVTMVVEEFAGGEGDALVRDAASDDDRATGKILTEVVDAFAGRRLGNFRGAE